VVTESMSLYGPPRVTKLPIIEPSPERADAARNRRKILDVARGLVASGGAAGVSLHDVAHAAGVGVGTIYRRFGDRAGLFSALLSEIERDFQEAFMYGPPPLGPGGPPAERVSAFLHALVDRAEDHHDLLVMAETSAPMARYDSAAYRLHRTHLAYLVAQLRPDANAEFLADALLAPLAASLLGYQRRQRGLSVAAIKAGIDDLLRLAVQPAQGDLK
jgi:AcrR family transcriptional regulator